MPGPLTQAALCGVAGTLGLATGMPARDFVDACMLLMGRGGPPNFKKLVARLERELEAGMVAEFGGAEAVAAVRGTVEGLLARHGRSLRQCVALDLCPAKIAKAVLEDGGDLLGDEIRESLDRCRLIIERVYAAIFADPGAIAQLMPDA